GFELAPGLDDRPGRLAEVVHVVEWIVEAEDVDTALRRAGDEPPREVAPDRARPDEEPASKGERERRRRAALQRADPLPRALDPTANRRVEDAAAGHLEVREPRAVEDLREAEKVGRRHETGERLLAQDANRRVDEARHGETLAWRLSTLSRDDGLHRPYERRTCRPPSLA